MSHSECTKPVTDNRDQILSPSEYGLRDSGTITPNDHYPTITSPESDQLPEKFSTISIPVAAVRPGEVDNTFVREQPW
jgi:hypothetical protein